MSEYKVLSLDKKQTKTGKDYYKARVENETGAEFADVAIWSDFPNFTTLVAGDLVNGELEQGKFGWTLKSNDREARLMPRFTQGKTAAVAQAMERKEQAIYNAQENKEQSIRIASTASGATAIIAARIESGEKVDWKKEWLATRKWLFENWTNTDAYPSDIVPEDAPF